MAEDDKIDESNNTEKLQGNSKINADYKPVNIYCASCGSPAKFDIASQVYHCQYCGAETGIKETLQEKQGFRKLHREGLEHAERKFPLYSCSCTGCGATIVFSENEALTDCAFCGRSLVRKDYLGVEGFPELLIPFKLTEDEARARLSDWCSKNSSKREARELKRHSDELRGFYLPYELVKGPTNCTVHREGTGRAYHALGFLEGSFINTSVQLDNLLLDGMEPYNTDEIREFEFSYLAGQRVKIRDIDDTETAVRVRNEIAANYEIHISKTMETKAVNVAPDTDSLLKLSAVLPAYYLRAGNTLAAVNGQTGKVAVRESKDRFLLPWQLRPIGWTIVISAVVSLFACLFGAEPMGNLIITGCIAIFMLIVLFTAYHDMYQGERRWRLRRRIFTSDNEKNSVSAPEFYENIEGKMRRVKLRFTTPLRMLKMLGIAAGVVFLPFIIAFISNGFSVEGFHIGGAAVWLCVTVPIAPVYLLKFGRLDLYEHPLIWYSGPDGRMVRLRGNKKGFRETFDSVKEFILNPAVLIGVAVVLLVLFINVHLILHWDEY